MSIERGTRPPELTDDTPLLRGAALDQMVCENGCHVRLLIWAPAYAAAAELILTAEQFDEYLTESRANFDASQATRKRRDNR